MLIFGDKKIKGNILLKIETYDRFGRMEFSYRITFNKTVGFPLDRGREGI